MKFIHTEIYEIKDFEKFKKLNRFKKNFKEIDLTIEEFEEIVLFNINNLEDVGISNYDEMWTKEN